MNGLTFVLPLLAISAGVLIACLRAIRERERQARVEAHQLSVWLRPMSEAWIERQRGDHHA